MTVKSTSTHLVDNTEPQALAMGLLSIGFAGAALAAPRSMSALSSLPRNRVLIHAIALRDLMIGVALLARRTRRIGFALRALADTGDGVLIATQLANRERNPVRGGLALATAVASATAAMRSVFTSAPPRTATES
jgi:hypothetical protein